MGDPIRTWAGECSAWECDGLGHMNMRHYMTKVHQARQMFFIHLGLDEAFKRDSVSSVRVRDFHIKYLGEARPDNPLYIETGLLELGEDELRLCHIMYHQDERMAATIVENIEHISLLTQQKFAWSQRFRSEARAYKVALPDPAKPRGFTYKTRARAMTESALIKLGLTAQGEGVFQPAEIGLDGAATPQVLMGRVTESIGHFKDGFPEFLDPEYFKSNKSAALLEARIFINRRVEAGDAFRFYPSVNSADKYTRRFAHNIVDVVSGESIASVLAVSGLFDLSTRKLIHTTPAQLKVLKPNFTAGLMTG